MSPALRLSGPSLAVETTRRRLAPLNLGEGPDADVDCSISWYGPAKIAAERPASEATVQALSGLMHLHGRDEGRPRRVGLEVASVAAGVLAASGALAALIARSRGRRVPTVQTSVLEGALMFACHYVAAATTDDETHFPPPQSEPGPPFATSDGHRFEIETLDPEAWRTFWHRLGAVGADLGRAWALFRARYYSGCCSLPPGLHEATRRHPLSELTSIAAECRVSLSRVRHYHEVLADPGLSPGHPDIHDLDLGAASPAPASASGAASTPGGELPLAGIKIVETTTRMQGPLAGLLLQMLGAHVTKVEPPGGDFGRVVSPSAGGTGSFFLCLNRGKHSVEIDLGTPAGRDELADLVAESDVFLHNWRPGKAAQWGLEADDLARRNPGLVYTEASGWGALAEPAHLVGTDFLVQAYAGTGDGLCPEGEAAVPSRFLLTDCMGALNTCEGMLRGLYQRELTGQGCRVGTSLFNGGMSIQAHVLEAMAASREHRRRQGRPLWGALDHPLQSAQGVLVVSAVDDDDLARLSRVCDVTPGPGADQRVAERLSAGSAIEWEESLVDAGIACAVIDRQEDLAAMTTDPRFGNLFEPLAGTSVVPRSPWSFTA